MYIIYHFYHYYYYYIIKLNYFLDAITNVNCTFELRIEKKNIIPKFDLVKVVKDMMNTNTYLSKSHLFLQRVLRLLMPKVLHSVRVNSFINIVITTNKSFLNSEKRMVKLYWGLKIFRVTEKSLTIAYKSTWVTTQSKWKDSSKMSFSPLCNITANYLLQKLATVLSIFWCEIKNSTIFYRKLKPFSSCEKHVINFTWSTWYKDLSKSNWDKISVLI